MENKQQTALSKVSHNVQVSYLNSSNFKSFSESLPECIKDAIGQPPISSLVRASSEHHVRLAIEFELVKLREMVNVGGNLTDFQIQFIAKQLYAQYPNESMADFKLCFERGATGIYGQIQRMDGVTIGVWMKKYLDEKYEQIEANLMDEKDTLYQRIEKAVDVLPIEQAQKYIDQMMAVFDSIEQKKPMPLTDGDIRMEGKEKPPRKRSQSYIPEFREQDRQAHFQKLKKMYPTLSTERINEIIDSWKK